MNRLILAAFLSLCACGPSATAGPGAVSTASPGAGGGTEVGPGSDVVCHDEVKTGSSIPHQVCRSKDQSQDDRDGARNFINQPRTVPVPPVH